MTECHKGGSEGDAFGPGGTLIQRWLFKDSVQFPKGVVQSESENSLSITIAVPFTTRHVSYLKDDPLHATPASLSGTTPHEPSGSTPPAVPSRCVHRESEKSAGMMRKRVISRDRKKKKKTHTCPLHSSCFPTSFIWSENQKHHPDNHGGGKVWGWDGQDTMRVEERFLMHHNEKMRCT